MRIVILKWAGVALLFFAVAGAAAAIQLANLSQLMQGHIL